MLSLRAFWAVKSAVCPLLCASLLVAQQPPAAAPSTPAPEVVFSVTTTLVQVDAVVTDSKGNYVTDLTADDFAVYDDGRPQKITNFSYISVTPQSTTAYKPEKKPVAKLDRTLPPSPAGPM